jgi:hypothetical protein
MPVFGLVGEVAEGGRGERGVLDDRVRDLLGFGKFRHSHDTDTTHEKNKQG